MTDVQVTSPASNRRAPMMAFATFLGAILTPIPYAVFSRMPATVVASILAFIFLCVIAEVRHRTTEPGLPSVFVFGCFDGLCGEIAVLAGQLVRSASGTASIFLVGASLAAGAAVSMGLGEWLGDNYGVPRPAALLQTFATAAAAIAAGVAVALIVGAA